MNTLRGHDITQVEGVWYYTDTMTPTAGNRRACGHCGRGDTAEGHDGCLGTLPGKVMNACCGHGVTQDAYVQYGPHNDVRGHAVLWSPCVRTP